MARRRRGEGQATRTVLQERRGSFSAEESRGSRTRADFRVSGTEPTYQTEHWRHWRSASYVALTRQRESAKVFVARETARDALTWSTRQDGTLHQVRALLSPPGRDFLDVLGDKIDRETRGADAERGQLKLHAARELAEKEIREGPIDPALAWRQAAAGKGGAGSPQGPREAEAEHRAAGQP